ncbi:hypothetical protein BDZ85DRAFT_301117 [Elsinoe ampelina]|uniref:P-loop containing nucleoside triphosphate hydrolase protein n=1 Tax=Elsinoe ampelina TaxID=302913 RepID=A0A6A6GRD8_9PEZI|nr:hypothetical protein BDZ85DRAFT_301117 [Elsinoe ampelina]
MAIPPAEWSLKGRFDKVKSTDSKFHRSNYDHQRLSSFTRKCAYIRVGDELLRGTDDGHQILFTMNISPLEHKFELELRLSPAAQSGKDKEKFHKALEANTKNRMAVHFSAHMNSSKDRVSQPYSGPGEYPASSNAITFSSQLQAVECVLLSDYEAAKHVKLPAPVQGFASSAASIQAGRSTGNVFPQGPRSGNAVTDNRGTGRGRSNSNILPGAGRGGGHTGGARQSSNAEPEYLLVTWKADSGQAFAFSRNTQNLPRAAQDAAAKFRKMLTEFKTGSASIQVVMPHMKGLLTQTWPRFKSLPTPTPVSYFPWLRQTSGGELIEVLALNGPFRVEHDSRWIDTALATSSGFTTTSPRPSGSTLSAEGVNKLEPLPLKLKYHDARDIAQTLDGQHLCDVFPDNSLGGTNLYLIALKVGRIGSHQVDFEKEATLEAQETSVEVGERVRIDITMDQSLGKEEWHGKVVRIPDQYRKFGHNVAVIADRPLQPGGMVLTSRRLVADFHFGHAGGSSRGLRERIVELMLGPTASNTSIRNFLLSHDNNNLQLPFVVNGHPDNWINEIDTKYLKPRNLNPEQRAVIFHYLQNRVTILASPPGTGKSTIIDIIIQIEEEYFKRSFWALADSNAAVDVLAGMYMERRKEKQISGIYRVRPGFEEQYIEDDLHGGGSGLSSLPGFRVLPPASSQEQLNGRVRITGGATKPLSLSAAISKRAQSLHRGEAFKVQYSEEEAHLTAFNDAHRAATSIRLQDSMSPSDRAFTEEKMRRDQLRAFQRLQRAYVASSRGIFSTASAASNPALQSIQPQALIMDESSQMMEARATRVIAHAMAGGRLDRILMVGDEHQLPPTITAEKNPFEKNGKMSQFERLVLAESKVFMLKEQYRCHPQISSILNRLIYQGQLRNAPITTGRTGHIGSFTKFVKENLLPSSHPLQKSSEPICSLVLSPVQSKDYSSWLSQKRPGSTSRLNFLTAALVLNVTSRLLKAKLSKKDILISAFYAGHLQSSWIEDSLRQNYDSVVKTYAYQGRPSEAGRTVMHPEVASKEAVFSKETTRVVASPDRLLSLMVDVTGVSDEMARRYIVKAEGELHVAIETYYRDYPIKDEAVDID